ncbi:hypothetical protein KCU90_g237, partial [Aureobasidium melanogenum]
MMIASTSKAYRWLFVCLARSAAIHSRGSFARVNHDASMINLALLEGAICLVDSVSAVELARECRMEVDDRYGSLLQWLEESGSKNVHPASADNQIGLVGEH